MSQSRNNYKKNLSFTSALRQTSRIKVKKANGELQFDRYTFLDKHFVSKIQFLGRCWFITIRAAMPNPSLNGQERRNSPLPPETVALGQGYILFRGCWRLSIMFLFCEYTENSFLSTIWHVSWTKNWHWLKFTLICGTSPRPRR